MSFLFFILRILNDIASNLTCRIADLCSVEIIQEILTLSGASPPPLGQPPVAMTQYILQPNSGHRNAPRPPTGDWWRKRGAIFHMKKYFLQSKIKDIYRALICNQ